MSLGLVFENNEIKHQTLVGVQRNSISKDTYTHTHTHTKLPLSLSGTDKVT